MPVVSSMPSPSLIRPALNTLTALSPRRLSSLVRPTICTCCTSPSIPRSQGAPSITQRTPGSQQPRRTAFGNIILPTRSFTAAAPKYQANSSTSPLPNEDDHQNPVASDTAVEPPDYLSEGELKVFEKLKLELQPLKLEVRSHVPNATCRSQSAGSSSSFPCSPLEPLPRIAQSRTADYPRKGRPLAAAYPNIHPNLNPSLRSCLQISCYNIPITNSLRQVQDISGGCGSMYGLDIISPRFKGLSVIQQHKLVNGVLKEELKEWHGVQLKTKAP